MVAGNIIFDLDGTLWDSSESVARSWTEAIRLSGEPLLRDKVITGEQIRGVMGMTMDDIANTLFPDLSPTRRLELLDRCTREEDNYIASNGGRLYMDEKLLSKLGADKRLFIVSNCHCGYIEAFFEYTGFERFFSDYLCWGDTGKPKSETIKQLIEKNGCVSPVYVGDTRGDYTAAKNAGVPFIHAAYGFGKLNGNDEPAAVIRSFAELLDVCSTGRR